MPSGAQLLPWLAPVAVALAVAKLSEHRLEYVIAGGVALLVLRWAYRHPGPAASVLAVLVVVQAVGFSILYTLHFPHFALRAGGALKDLMGIGVLLSAVVHMRRTHRRVDWLDVLVFAYIGVVTAYLLLPSLFAPLSPSQWTIRLLSWRLDAGYIVLLFGFRHAPISATGRRWFVRTVVAMGALVVGFAIYQFASPRGFEHLIVDTWKQVAYQENVSHSKPASVAKSLYYVTLTSGRVHVGSILLSPFEMCDYLVVVGAVVLERLVRRRGHPALYALLAGIVFSLFVSQVRADAVAFLVVVVVALLPAPGRPVIARWGLVLAIALGAALVVPALGGSRFVGGGNAASSTSGHIRELEAGLRTIGHYPLGLGLGNNPVTSARFLDPGTPLYASDNSFLQVGDELGVLALAAWLPLVFGTLVMLRRRARAPDTMAAAAGLALLGILVAGLFHHVFLDFSASWTVWALAGLGLAGASPGRRAPAGTPRRAEPRPTALAASNQL